MFLQKVEPIMEERKELNVQIQANLPHDTFHTKNALTYIKVRCSTTRSRCPPVHLRRPLRLLQAHRHKKASLCKALQGRPRALQGRPQCTAMRQGVAHQAGPHLQPQPWRRG